MPSYYESEDLARFSELSKTNPDAFKKFMDWYGHTLESGLVDAKTKQLIGLAVSFAVQCPYCIDAYAKGCSDAGWSPEEMGEAVSLAASIKGGAVIAHWAQATNTLERDE